MHPATVPIDPGTGVHWDNRKLLGNWKTFQKLHEDR